MGTLNKPEELTYFIAWEGESTHYGSVSTIQCMATGLENLETFTVGSLYLARLLEFGIELPNE